jgi:DNA adenine methylase
LGGKSRLAKPILSQFPKHTCYVEPFCGGAAIFLKKKPSKSEVINDVDGELINLYRCIQNDPKELIRQSATLLHSREFFNQLKAQCKNNLTDIQRAASFYAINKMAFGGKMVNSSFGYTRTRKAKLSAVKFHHDIEKLTVRLDRVHIENTSWEDCIKRYDS